MFAVLGAAGGAIAAVVIGISGAVAAGTTTLAMLIPGAILYALAGAFVGAGTGAVFGAMVGAAGSLIKSLITSGRGQVCAAVSKQRGPGINDGRNPNRETNIVPDRSPMMGRAGRIQYAGRY